MRERSGTGRTAAVLRHSVGLGLRQGVFSAGRGVPAEGRTDRTDLHGGHELLMAQPARDNRISRRSWLLAGLAIPVFRLRGAEALAVSFDGDNLHVAAPGLHFLTGKPLERLKDGDAVAFVSQITLFSDERGTVIRRRYRDRLGGELRLVGGEVLRSRSRASPRSRSHLTAAAGGELGASTTWPSARWGWRPNAPSGCASSCVRPIPARFRRLMGESGISFSGLVEILSRKTEGRRSALEAAGPVRCGCPICPARSRRGRESGEPPSQQADSDLSGGHAGAAGRHRLDHHLAARTERRSIGQRAARHA